MANFLRALSKAISSGSEAAKDQVSQAIENTGYWKDKAVDSTVKVAETATTEAAKFILKDDLAGNFGEGLAEYQGKRVGVFVGSLLGQAIDVGIDQATGKAIQVASVNAPEIAGSIAKSMGKSEDTAKSATSAVAQGIEKGLENGGKGAELIEVGEDINTARHEGIGETVEAVGKIAPKLLAMAGKPGEMLSIPAAGTLQVLTDDDGRRDIENGINNLKESFSNTANRLGEKTTEAFIAASSIIPDAICSEDIKRIRESRKMIEEVEAKPPTSGSPKV